MVEAASPEAKHKETIYFRGTSGCRSAHPPRMGWKMMPDRQRTAMMIPVSPLVKPRSWSRAA